MRAVVTRVTSASVTIDGRVNGKIGPGFLVLLGVGPEDTEQAALRLADKICGCRVFEDENGKMNRNLASVGGSLLVVSQFTLYADLKLLPRRKAGRGHPPVRAVHAGLPGAGLFRRARRVWGRYEGGIRQ